MQNYCPISLINRSTKNINKIFANSTQEHTKKCYPSLLQSFGYSSNVQINKHNLLYKQSKRHKPPFIRYRKDF